MVPLPICPGSLRDGNGTQRKPRNQESVNLKSERRRRKGNRKGRIWRRRRSGPRSCSGCRAWRRCRWPLSRTALLENLRVAGCRVQGAGAAEHPRCERSIFGRQDGAAHRARARNRTTRRVTASNLLAISDREMKCRFPGTAPSASPRARAGIAARRGELAAGTARV